MADAAAPPQGRQQRTKAANRSGSCVAQCVPVAAFAQNGSAEPSFGLIGERVITGGEYDGFAPHRTGRGARADMLFDFGESSVVGVDPYSFSIGRRGMLVNSMGRQRRYRLTIALSSGVVVTAISYAFRP